jgi:hypothetical protein
MVPNFIGFEERKSVQIPKVSGKNHTQDSRPQTGNQKYLKNDENHQFTQNNQNLLMCTNVRNVKVVVRRYFDCCAIIRHLPVLGRFTDFSLIRKAV